MSLTIPYISIKPGYLTFFAVPQYETPKLAITPEIRANLRKNSPDGKISMKSKRRISTAIDWLLYLSNPKKFYSPKHKKTFSFRLNFITLTLASKQIHSDQEIKSKLLNQFLIELKRDHNVRKYIWRAESQRNDNIHFHVVTDRFIPWSTLRKSWNRIQAKLGYVDAYRHEMLEHHKNGFRSRPELFKTWDLQSQKRAHKAGMRGNWSNPNTTDVHAIYKIRNLSSYLSKYFTKEDKYKLKSTGDSRDYVTEHNGERTVLTVTCVERVPLLRPINGKLWGLSHSLSKLRGIILEITWNIQQELDRLYNSNKAKFRFNDYYTVFYCPVKQWLTDRLPNTLAAFRSQLADLVSSETANSLGLNLFSGGSPPLAMESSNNALNSLPMVLPNRQYSLTL